MSMPSSVSDLLALQSGVISRRQALTHGLRPHDIRRLLRRRGWAAAVTGVYVARTGELTWLQRAWVGVLAAWPAALTHRSAIRAASIPGLRGHDDAGPLHVAVDRSRRTLVTPPGVALHHLADLERDLDTAVTGRLTVRLGWGQVFDRPCSTAAALGDIARQRGWTGALRGCPNCPGGSVPTI